MRKSISTEEWENSKQIQIFNQNLWKMIKTTWVKKEIKLKYWWNIILVVFKLAKLQMIICHILTRLTGNSCILLVEI